MSEKITREKNMDTTTNCHDCHFIEVENSQQTGCSLGRIKAFKANKTPMETVVQNGLSALRIDRYCLAARPQGWCGDEDAKAKVREEMRTSLSLIIVVQKPNVEDDEDCMSRLCRTLEYINKMEYLPQRIIVVLNNANDPRKYVNLLNNADVNKLEYRTVNNLEGESAYEWLVDLGVARCSSMCQVYTSYSSGQPIPADLLTKIDNHYNVDLKPSVIIYAYGDYHLVVSKAFHKVLSGNDAGYIEDKAEALAKEQEKMNMLGHWEDILNE